MVDKALMEEIEEIYENEKVLEDPKSTLRILELVKNICVEDEELKEELEDMNEIIMQAIITNPDFFYWVKVGNGTFEYGEGQIENPTFVMKGNQQTMGGMLAGEVDATSAYMAGELSIEGNIQDAMAYGDILGLAMGAFQNMIEE